MLMPYPHTDDVIARVAPATTEELTAVKVLSSWAGDYVHLATYLVLEDPAELYELLRLVPWNPYLRKTIGPARLNALSWDVARAAVEETYDAASEEALRFAEGGAAIRDADPYTREQLYDKAVTRRTRRMEQRRPGRGPF